MNEKEIEEETPQEQIKRIKTQLQKAGAGVAIMAIGGIGAPILGSYLFHDTRTFLLMATITVPLTIVYAIILCVKWKGYFERKKALETENEKNESANHTNDPAKA